jgi:metal-responsive CopG/Arc/MetJ family transcriptional regulator
MATKMKRPPRRTARVSVSFPAELYGTLEQIAKDKKVSVAWVIRDAADKYIAERWPLLETRT